METISRTINEKGETAFRTSTGLLVNQGVRRIQSGDQYDHLIDTKSVQFTSTFTEGTVEDTVLMMCELIRKHHGQVKALADFLKKESRIKTLESIWDFVFHHIQYKRDKVGVEQLSTPARIWLNRSTPNTPSDCDDHTVFVGSLLYCLGIPFTIRIAGYGGKPYSHVYVICGDVCIDTVLHRFNCEAKYTSKKDKQMQIETLAGHGENELEGLGALSELHQSGEDFDSTMQNIEKQEELNGIQDSGLDTEEQALRLLGKTQLATTLREYEKEPEKYHALGFGRRYWEHMKGAFQALKNGDSLDGIIIKLNDGSEWEKANLSPLNGMSLEGETIGLLGALDGFFKKFRRKLKKAVKSVGRGIKKAVKFVGKGFKKIGKFLMKINPINIAIRAVLRSKISKNKKDLAIKMGYGLLSKAQAKQLGVDTESWKKSKQAYAKFAKKYKFLGGKESKLRKVLISAWQKATKKANMPSMNLSGNLGQLEGRRRRRRKRRKAQAKAQQLLASRKRAGKTTARKPVSTEKPMSAYEKERLEFLKLVHRDIAKQELGIVATATTGAILAKVALILAPILKILKSLGLGKMITKLKEKRIENLSERIANEPDPVKRQALEAKKTRAENNLAIFNNVAKKPNPTPDSNVPPSPRNIAPVTYPANAESGADNADSMQSMTSQNKRQAGMNPFAIGALILVGGGLLWGTNKKKSNQSKK
ncbi:hypothetical protein [Labilibaculum euxinus]